MIKIIQKIKDLFIRENDVEEYIDNTITITNDVRMTAGSWSSYYDTVVFLPTGFPYSGFPNKGGFDWRTTLMTEKQFLEYAEGSTIQFNDKINPALEMLKHERLKNMA